MWDELIDYIRKTFLLSLNNFAFCLPHKTLFFLLYFIIKSNTIKSNEVYHCFLFLLFFFLIH